MPDKTMIQNWVSASFLAITNVETHFWFSAITIGSLTFLTYTHTCEGSQTMPIMGMIAGHYLGKQSTAVDNG